MSTYKISVFTDALDGVDLGGETEVSVLKGLLEGDYLSLAGREAVRILDVADCRSEAIELSSETMAGIDNFIMNEKPGMMRSELVAQLFERHAKERDEVEHEASPSIN